MYAFVTVYIDALISGQKLVSYIFVKRGIQFDMNFNVMLIIKLTIIYNEHICYKLLVFLCIIFYIGMLYIVCACNYISCCSDIL